MELNILNNYKNNIKVFYNYYYPLLAQLEEQSTVVVFCSLSIGRWFESDREDQTYVM